MKRTTTIAAITIAAVLLSAMLSGCARQVDAASKSSTPSLVGTWFDDKTGTQYLFASDHLLVVPREVPGGGNAVTYSRIATDSIDVVYSGVHRVSVIDELTTDRLVLADPLTDDRQLFLSDAGRTTFASELATPAVEHASAVASITAATDIDWVADQPENLDPDWTTWSPSTLDAYAAEWDWAALKRAAAPIVATGGGANLTFTFTLERKVPSAAELETAHAALKGAAADSSAEPTAGLRYIDVGYSASKAGYDAGTLVYLPGGFIYSLGDGYAIPVGLDPATESFVPITHS
jgi:hypothetical protein